jgi:predicted nuclease of predicted toxin-antitoxin system
LTPTPNSGRQAQDRREPADDLADLFVRHGYDAATVADQGWRGAPDPDLWQGIQDEGRWLVTADKDLADRRHRPPGTHAGIILLRAGEEGLDAYLALAQTVIDDINLDNAAGAVIVATDRGLRIRRAP